MTLVLRWQHRHQKAIHAYRQRLTDRLARVEEDVAWARRGPAVIHALMLAEEKRRRGDQLVAEEFGLQLVDDREWSVRA